MEVKLRHDVAGAARQFQIWGEFLQAEPYGSGHINDTYCVVCSQAGTPVRYILQRINHNIFKKPTELMENIQRVTRHLAVKLAGQNAAAPIFIDRALKNEPIIIHGDGNQTRDFIYVKDIVAANVFFGTQSIAAGVFNVAYGQSATINKLAETICRLTSSRSEIRHAAERSGDVKHSLAAIEKNRAAGFVLGSNLTEGLVATINSFLIKAK